MRERLAERARHAVYGSVIVMAVIIALDDTQVSNREAIVSVVGAAFVTMLAELYADYLSRTIEDAHHPSAEQRSIGIRDALAGFAAACLPVVFFILSALDVLSLHAAFNAAVWTGVGVLGSYAFAANRIAGLSVFSSLIVGFGFVVVGAVLVILKSLA